MKPCPDCELYKEEKAETFLETLLNVLQQINAEKSCAPKRKKRHLERKKKKRENLKNMIWRSSIVDSWSSSGGVSK